MRLPRLVLPALLLFACHVRGDDLLPADWPIEQVVDHYVDARLRQVKVEPAPQVDDYTLIRRLTLDLVGRIPTLPESTAFVAATDSQKRVKLVDRLMASPAFVRHQATQFDAMMASANGRNSGGLRDYLVKSLGANKSWDRVFRELLLPDDADPAQKGASDFLKSRVADLDRVTNDVSVIFFGVSVSCAQCHDHPLVADWKQDHFFGMKSFFARTFDNGGFLAEREFGQVKFKPSKGPERQAKMMFLSGAAIDAPGQKEPNKDDEKKDREKFEKFKKDKKAPPPPVFSARAKLVEVALQTKESDYFSRSIVNRLWHRFIGFGLVMPLEQMHSENPPSHPALLNWLARDTAAHGYDLRRTIRGLVLSQAYSRSSRWKGDAPPAPALFAVGRLKALTPMQLATSLKIATSDPQAFEAVKPDDLDKRIEGIEGSVRGFAGQIAQPTDDFQIGVSEALLFSNNDRLLRDFIGDGGDRLTNRLKNVTDPAKAADVLVRAILSRPPTADELAAMTDYISRRKDRLQEAYKQVIWALVSGAEFRFNY